MRKEPEKELVWDTKKVRRMDESWVEQWENYSAYWWERKMDESWVEQWESYSAHLSETKWGCARVGKKEIQKEFR